MSPRATRIIPNFFVVGAAKAGTTSLYYNLRRHPEIFLTRMKELNFFSSEELLAQGCNYRGSQIINDLDEYLGLFRKAKTRKAVGDVSPSYLFRASAAKKIFNFNSAAKIIVVLRNPVERAYSDYLMDITGGHFNYSFEDIVHKRVNDIKQSIYFQIIERGLYFEQVNRYLDFFGKHNVRIFLFDELKEDISSVLRSIFEFIGVDHSVRIDPPIKANPFKRPKRFTKLMYYNHSVSHFAKKLMPYPVIRGLFRVFFDTQKPELSEETRKYLKKFYRADIIFLQELIGRNLEHWL